MLQEAADQVSGGPCSPFLPGAASPALQRHTCASQQGHIKAAEFIGCIYNWGQGVAIDYPRAMAAYKVGAEGGVAACQWQVVFMYYEDRGVDVNYKQALPWIEKAAAQNHPEAIGQLWDMYVFGEGVALYRTGHSSSRGATAGALARLTFCRLLSSPPQLSPHHTTLHRTA
jgi:TPR repeat protein